MREYSDSCVGKIIHRYIYELCKRISGSTDSFLYGITSDLLQACELACCKEMCRILVTAYVSCILILFSLLHYSLLVKIHQLTGDGGNDQEQQDDADSEDV